MNWARVGPCSGHPPSPEAPRLANDGSSNRWNDRFTYLHFLARFDSTVHVRYVHVLY